MNRCHLPQLAWNMLAALGIRGDEFNEMDRMLDYETPSASIRVPESKPALKVDSKAVWAKRITDTACGL